MSPIKESESCSYKAFCFSCGSFLFESKGNTTAGLVCPICGKDLIVNVKKGKVSVIEDTERTADPPEYRRRIRLRSYSNRVK